MIRLFENLWLKLIALLMGLLLWFHVATEKVYNHRVVLPVTDVLLSDSLTLATDPPDSLTVVVAAPGKQLLRSQWRKRGLRINASQYRPGRFNLNLNPSNTSLTLSDGNLALDEIISPTSCMLHVDYQAEKSVRIVADIVPTSDQGFVVASLGEPEPATVALKGARSVLRNIAEVRTERRELHGLRNSIELMLQVLSPDLYGVTVEPDSVSVRVEVVPVKTRLFEAVPVVVYNSPPGRDVKCEPPTVDVELTGPPEDIGLLNRNALVASVDYHQLDSTGKASIKIDCPTRFSVKQVSVQTVNILID